MVSPRRHRTRIMTENRRKVKAERLSGAIQKNTTDYGKHGQTKGLTYAAENDENDDGKDDVSIHHFLEVGLFVSRARIVQHHLKTNKSDE